MRPSLSTMRMAVAGSVIKDEKASANGFLRNTTRSAKAPGATTPTSPSMLKSWAHVVVAERSTDAGLWTRHRSENSSSWCLCMPPNKSLPKQMFTPWFSANASASKPLPRRSLTCHIHFIRSIEQQFKVGYFSMFLQLLPSGFRRQNFVLHSQSYNDEASAKIVLKIGPRPILLWISEVYVCYTKGPPNCVPLSVGGVVIKIRRRSLISIIDHASLGWCLFFGLDLTAHQFQIYGSDQEKWSNNTVAYLKVCEPIVGTFDSTYTSGCWMRA